LVAGGRVSVSVTVSRTMRVPLILTAFIAIASSADAECLSSAESVLAAHPGSHAVWTRRLPGHTGEKCWFASSDETRVIHADDSGDDARQMTLSARGTPLPRPRSQDVPAATEPAPVTGSEDSRDPSREIGAMSVIVPPPLPPSQETATERAPPPASVKPDPTTGGAKSILIWGRPMGLDATWEEIFTGRERAAK
jgi:hypothetical protein